MKNVWKGLVLGALTGAGIGLILDLLEWLGRRGQELSIEAREEAQQLSGAARTKVSESDLPDKARAVAGKVGEKVAETVEDLTEKLKEAEVPERVAGATQAARAKVSERAGAARN